MLLAGACACMEKDFKKIVAISTLSQLGMMFYVLSIGLWRLSFLHMMVHAFFKRILFLRSGSLISHNGGGQDSRFYGAERWSRSSYLYFIVRCLSLSGFPFIIGFYSKDYMLGEVMGSFSGFFYFTFLFRCGLTIMYSLRLILIGYQAGVKGFVVNSIYEDRDFVFPVYFLFMACCFSGGVLSWFFLSGVRVALRGLDYLVGLILIVLFFASVFVLGQLRVFLDFFGRISFLV